MGRLSSFRRVRNCDPGSAVKQFQIKNKVGAYFCVKATLAPNENMRQVRPIRGTVRTLSTGPACLFIFLPRESLHIHQLSQIIFKEAMLFLPASTFLPPDIWRTPVFSFPCTFLSALTYSLRVLAVRSVKINRPWSDWKSLSWFEPWSVHNSCTFTLSLSLSPLLCSDVFDALISSVWVDFRWTWRTTCIFLP